MSGFKAQILSDVQRVFLNPDEFAELHSIEGVDLLCIVNDSEGQATSATSEGMKNASTLGLASCDRLVSLATYDLGRIPLPGEKISMDGDFWYVADGVSEASGLLTLPLNRAY